MGREEAGQHAVVGQAACAAVEPCSQGLLSQAGRPCDQRWRPAALARAHTAPALPHPHQHTSTPHPPHTLPAQALTAYHADVVSHSFPSAAFSPYKIAAKETEQLLRDLEREGLDAAAEAVEEHRTGSGSGSGSGSCSCSSGGSK